MSDAMNAATADGTPSAPVSPASVGDLRAEMDRLPDGAQILVETYDGSQFEVRREAAAGDERVRSWPCGCSSDNAVLTACGEHDGPIGTAVNLRSTDPRLNVVFGPATVTLHFLTSQGGPGRASARLSRDSLMKVMALMGDLDQTPDPEGDDV
jgi:hypothetical protein